MSLGDAAQHLSIQQHHFSLIFDSILFDFPPPIQLTCMPFWLYSPVNSRQLTEQETSIALSIFPSQLMHLLPST